MLIRRAASRTVVRPSYDPSATWMGRAYERSRIVKINLAVLKGISEDVRTAMVLHELGHIVDFGLISEPLRRKMLSQIPGDTDASETFAETFARWALRGNFPPNVGHGLPAPRSSLEDWGAPLAAIAARQP